MDSLPAIVVGVDFSPASERALEAAIKTAKDWKASIELVHALTPLGAPGLDLQHPAFDPPRNESADVTASAPQTPESWLERVRSAGVPAWLVTRPGPAAIVLVREAERIHARAIVVGSHGRGGLGKAMLGSVAQTVLERSTVPVIVVPGAHGAGAA
ncbi:MAG: universal stress protein [Thermoplasmatota archaeon]|nr:universal stress protein [Halobacteriales archaeon]